MHNIHNIYIYNMRIERESKEEKMILKKKLSQFNNIYYIYAKLKHTHIHTRAIFTKKK